MPVREIGPASSIYQAYAGPDVGGFGLVPQSAVPQLDPGTNLPSELGIQSLDEPLPVGDLFTDKPKSGEVRELGPLSAFNQPATAPQPASTATPMAASTIAPKGGTPYQPNVIMDQALEDFRKLMQPISRHEQAVKDQLAASRTPIGNIVQSHITGVGDAIMHTPSVIADVLTYPDRRRVAIEEDRPLSSEPMFGATPRYGVREGGAFLSSLKQKAGGKGPTYEQGLAQYDVDEASRREAYPWASWTGDLTGATEVMAGLRSPFVEKLRQFEYGTSKRMNKGRTMYQHGQFASRAERSKVLAQSPGFNALLRGTGRTAEAGLEGAAYDILNDAEDPASAAAFSAGAQGALSFGSEAALRKFGKLPSRVATFALNGAILSGLFYALDVAAPGEARDYEAQRTAVQKILLGYTVGAGLSLFGARARSGAGSIDFPHLTDAIASGPRNSMQKVMIDYLNRDDVGKLDLKTKLVSMYQNLDKFSEPQLRDLSAAFAAGGTRFYNELDKTLKELPPQ